MGEAARSRWAQDVEEVRRRYRSIAPVYPLFEVLFGLPWGARRRAVDRLRLQPGARVLEAGCGTGRNLPYLVAAVGPRGRVYGLDVSTEMLAVARRRCARHRWENVVLLQGDARTFPVPEPVDAVLFSLSYAVMPRSRDVLRHVWELLVPGGIVVVLDAKLPPGTVGAVLRPVVVAVSHRSVLGNPDVRPWEELAELAARVDHEELQFGSYYICAGRKAGRSGVDFPGVAT